MEELFFLGGGGGGTFNTISRKLLSSRLKMAKSRKKAATTGGYNSCFYLLACFSLLDKVGLESHELKEVRVNEETRTGLKSFFFLFC